ncbi:MAG: hypothetical protein HeimC2_07740 [Candidatus Heimdallarchaeota archaeon LC_2]|nr:MAG: hypothetical protein HeimC2_07740 [Candidatus Heimdallarchaeota archaeon LC_2]
MVISNIRLTKLKRYHFVDADDNDIGSIEDLTLSKSTLEPLHFILGSHFFEELLEELGRKENIDEIAPINIVSEIDNEHVVLSESIDNLEITNEDGEIPDSKSIYRYSKILNYTIFDNSGELDAKLIDLVLNYDKTSFIFNYANLKTNLMKDGFYQRFEISVPISKIKIDDEKIIISTSEEEMIKNAKLQIKPKEKGKSTIMI